MKTRIPLTLTLAALVGFAAPALAAEHGGMKHDPQVATTTAKPKAHEKAATEKAAPAKETKASPAKGRHAKAAKAKHAAKTTAPAPAAQPATK